VALEPAATRGGGRATVLVATGCSFTDNAAPDGGAIMVTAICEGDASAECRRDGAYVNLTDTVVSGNRAIGCGYTSSSSAASSSCKSDGRLGSGGGISAAAGRVLLSDGSAVSNNTATASGGGVHSYGLAYLAVLGSRLDDNAAGDTGGALLNAGHTLAISSSSSFSRNKAKDGRASRYCSPRRRMPFVYIFDSCMNSSTRLGRSPL